MSKLYQAQEQERCSGKPAVSEFDIGRGAFKKDYSRLLHSPSFRRLQGKTQLFPGKESDFFRNRLTHSLEVAQIASGIADVLNHENPELGIDRDLVQFAAIAHDLGHPPFGHNGEHTLDELMAEHGGFEGNAQTLHILARLERKLVTIESVPRDDFGLDLTYRTLASILKYDLEIPNRKPGTDLVKGYYQSEKELVDEIKKRVAPGYSGPFKTLECSIMDVADDIAYSTYDLEDSLHAGFVTPFSLLDALFSNKPVYDTVTKKTNETLVEAGYDPLGENELQEAACSRLDVTHGVDSPWAPIGVASIDGARPKVYVSQVNSQFSADTLTRTAFTAERVGELILQVQLIKNEQYPALSKVVLSRKALIDVEMLKHLNFELVIRSPKLAIVQHRGKEIVKKIFHAIVKADGALLPNHWQEAYRAAEKPGRHRVICNFIAGMTDRYAVEFYDSLFGEGKGLYGPD